MILFLGENIGCGYQLEVSHPVIEYLQHVFTDIRPEKIIIRFLSSFKKKNGMGGWILFFIPGPYSEAVSHNKTKQLILTTMYKKKKSLVLILFS